jgi:LEM3-like protein/NUMOD3 motif-containing protein
MATGHPSTRSDFYIYALCRGDTGAPFYIGKGRRERWAFHEWEARNGGSGHKCNTIRSIWAAGFDVVKVKIHENLSEPDAHGYEAALIAALGRRPSGPLVNLTDGGDGVSGLIITREAREKMSAAKRGKKLTPESISKRSEALRGRAMPPEIREKISAAQRGKPRNKLTPDSIAKRSAAIRGQIRSVETRSRISAGNLGKKMSPESRAKMSIAKLGIKLTQEHVAKVAAANRGAKRNPQARANMSAAALRREAARRAAIMAAHLHRSSSADLPRGG